MEASVPERDGASGDPGRHEWIHIAVGRVCQLCMVVQVDGEFDDGVPCEPKGVTGTPDKERDTSER